MSDSDSDVPDLASRSCSEDDDDEDEHECGSCNCGPNKGDRVEDFHDRHDKEKHLQLIKIFTLSPFLLGTSHQPEIWLKYAHDSKLLPSTVPDQTFSRHVAVEDAYLHVAEVLEEAINLVQKQLSDKQVKMGDLRSLFESIDRSVFPYLDFMDHQPRPLEDVLHRAKDFAFLDAWKNLISSKQNIMKPERGLLLDDRQLVVCLLFVTRQYLSYVLSLEDRTQRSIYDDFEERRERNDREVAPMKDSGNNSFKAKDYKGAIQAYTAAIRVSRYNAILYGDRAQSYSHSKMYPEALSDSVRSIALKPTWHKGYYRCAQALFDMRRIERALKITELGIQRCPEDENLKDQMLRFTHYIRAHSLPGYKRMRKFHGLFHREDEPDFDDPPQLVTSSDNDSSTDSSGSDSESNSGETLQSDCLTVGLRRDPPE